MSVDKSVLEKIHKNDPTLTSPDIKYNQISDAGAKEIALALKDSKILMPPLIVPSAASKQADSDLIKQAQDHIDLEEYQAALELVDKVLQADAIHPRGLLIKGKAFEELGKKEEALFQYQAILNFCKATSDKAVLVIAEHRIAKLKKTALKEPSQVIDSSSETSTSVEKEPVSLNLAPAFKNEQLGLHFKEEKETLDKNKLQTTYVNVGLFKPSDVKLDAPASKDSSTNTSTRNFTKS